MTIARLMLRLAAIQVFIGLLAIGVSIGLGAPLSQGVIAFTNHLYQDESDIYVVDVGRAITYNLTQSPVFERDPVWSPDGSQLAFMSNPVSSTVGLTLYIMDASGRNIRRIVDARGDEIFYSLTWSPTGRYLAYVNGPFPQGGIEILDLQTNRHYPVTNMNLNTFGPAWSPDDGLLAFQVRQPIASTPPSALPFSIYVLDMTQLENPDAGLRQVVDFTQDFGQMVWSPDGRYVALTRSDPGIDDCADYEIVIVDVAVGEVVFETMNPAQDFRPVWSPDSSQLAFISDRDDTAYFCDGTPHIYIVDVNTGIIRQLTDYPGFVRSLVWSPDGREIVYLSEQPTDYAFYIIDSDGGLPRYIAQGFWSRIAWRPG